MKRKNKMESIKELDGHVTILKLNTQGSVSQTRKYHDIASNSEALRCLMNPKEYNVSVHKRKC